MSALDRCVILADADVSRYLADAEAAMVADVVRYEVSPHRVYDLAREVQKLRRERDPRAVLDAVVDAARTEREACARIADRLQAPEVARAIRARLSGKVGAR